MKKLMISLLTFMPMMASAQITADDFGLGAGDASANINLNQTADLETTVVNIVNMILGFLGLLAVVIILLGGFKWMTSQGNTEKVDEAKKLIGAGVVGLVIIITAFAIASFVISKILEVTV